MLHSVRGARCSKHLSEYHGRSYGVHVALAKKRTLCWSSQGVNLCFNTVWHASNLLGCRLRWWRPTGALPIDRRERNAISMLSLCVNGCFMQSSVLPSLLLFLSMSLYWRLRKHKTILCSRFETIFTLHIPPEHARICMDGMSARSHDNCHTSSCHLNDLQPTMTHHRVAQGVLRTAKHLTIDVHPHLTQAISHMVAELRGSAMTWEQVEAPELQDMDQIIKVPVVVRTTSA